MLRRMRWFTTVAVVISLVGGGLVFAQGTPGSMPDKMMSPPSPTDGAAGKASMPMEKGSMPAEKAGMDKPGMGMDKPGMGMDKPGMGMDKPGMGMDKPGMGMDKPGMGMDKPGMGMDKPGMATDKAGMAAGKAKAAAGPVDINMADEATLTSLKGIGPAKAKAIVAYRQKNGPFKNVDELVKVPGIGKKTLASLKDKLTLGKVM